MRSLRATTKSSPRLPQLEKARVQQQRPNTAKKTKQNKKTHPAGGVWGLWGRDGEIPFPSSLLLWTPSGASWLAGTLVQLCSMWGLQGVELNHSSSDLDLYKNDAKCSASLYTGAESNHGDRVLGEVEKNIFIAFPGKGGHSGLMHSKLCVIGLLPRKTVSPLGEGSEKFYSNVSKRAWSAHGRWWLDSSCIQREKYSWEWKS